MGKYNVNRQLLALPFRVSRTGGMLSPNADSKEQRVDEYGRPVFSSYVLKEGQHVGDSSNTDEDVAMNCYDDAAIERYVKSGALSKLGTTDEADSAPEQPKKTPARKTSK